MAIPDPAPLLVCIVAFAGLRSGLASAMVSAAIAVASSAWFFFDHGAASGYDTADLVRLAMLAVTAAGAAGITGLLRKRKLATLAWSSSTVPSGTIFRFPMRRPTASRHSSR